jgi:hypothetical protein
MFEAALAVRRVAEVAGTKVFAGFDAGEGRALTLTVQPGLVSRVSSTGDLIEGAGAM